MRRSMQATALMTTALLALTACGSGGGSGASQPQEQQTASATTADPSSVSGELTWWDTSDAANEAPVFKQMIERVTLQDGSSLAVPAAGLHSLRPRRRAAEVPLVLAGRTTDVVHHPVRPRPGARSVRSGSAE